MNKKNLEKRELRLGVMQVVVLLGFAIGSIVAAFCLGFFVGRSVGFEKEISNMVASLPKFPIASSEPTSDTGDQIVSEVYAKLNEQSPPSSGQAGSGPKADGSVDAVPELGSIKEADGQNAEVPPNVEADSAKPEAGKEEAPLAPEQAKPNEEVAPVVQETPQHKNADGTEKTLGGLISAHESAEKKVPTPIAEKSIKKEILREADSIDRKPPVQERPKTESSGSAAPQSNIPSGWFAQIAAPKKIEDAKQLSNSLKQSGFPVVIEAAQVRGEDYFRVLVGPEGSKSQADILLKQLKRESYIKGEPFLRMVK